jgi:hypothetical protein
MLIGRSLCQCGSQAELTLGGGGVPRALRGGSGAGVGPLAAHFSSVDFRQRLRPTIPKNSPRLTAKETFAQCANGLGPCAPDGVHCLLLRQRLDVLAGDVEGL